MSLLKLALKGIWNIIAKKGIMSFINIIDKIPRIYFFLNVDQTWTFLEYSILTCILMAKVKKTKQPMCIYGLLWSPFILNAECSLTLSMCISKPAHAPYLMPIEIYKINSNPLGKYSDLQHYMYSIRCFFNTKMYARYYRLQHS